MRGHERDHEDELHASGPWRDRPGGDADGRARCQSKRWRKRETVEPSFIWQTGAVAFLTSAAGVAVAAVTVSEDAAIRASELWIVAGGLALAAVLCFAAHWDVNRGRRSKHYETEELP